MPKKSVKTTNSKSKKSTKTSKKSKSVSQSKPIMSQPTTIESKLIENMVALQKINTNMAEKFDKLSKQIAHLLLLFETTAKSFAEQPGMEKDEELIRRLDTLIDQNKTIAKGISLLHDKVGEPQTPTPGPTPIPKKPIAQPMPAPQPAPTQPTQQTPQQAKPAPQQTPEKAPEQPPKDNKQVQEIPGTPAPQNKEFKPDASGRPLPKF